MKLALATVLALAACQVPAPSKPLTPTDAADSTFLIDMGEGTGTAWVVENRYEASYLVTAGHVCEDGVSDFKLVDRRGFSYPAHLVRKHTKWDLCLVRTDEVVGPTLELSPAWPEYDEPLMAVGAPLGIFGCDESECGMAPISRGSYAGGTLVSMPMMSGNSGSAVFTQRGVIGVLVSGYPRFPMLSFIEPLDHLREFVTK